MSRLRLGKQTPDDIRIFNNWAEYYTENKKEFENALHLCSRKKTTAKINDRFFSKIKREQPVHHIEAQDVYSIENQMGQKVD